MFRSLAFKWTATLFLTSLIGIILVGVFAYRATVSEYDRLRSDQARASFIEDVTAYYQANQTWVGLEDWLRVEPDPNIPPGIPQPPQQFALVDTNGIVVFGHGPFHTGDVLPASALTDGTPILLDGEQIGTALLAQPPPELDPREQLYVDSTNRALLIGALGASATALLIGLLLSRQFLRPLAELTEAITAMHSGNLDQRVQIRTRDELGILSQTFNEMSANLHRANQLRKQMTADIAHDLRTPLTVIAGNLEALRDGTFKPTPERFRVMSDEVGLLQRLVEDLRTLSLADAGELKLVYQPIQPGELLEQAKQVFEPIATEQQTALYVESSANLPVVEVDRERMAQVLANLLANALRYTPAEGTVKLLAREQTSSLQLIVEDSGEGIPENKLPYIFERFYRTDESRHEDQGASGLGLAIAKSIVEAHHGTITAESRVGQGTTMVITLPWKQPT
ncbi:MAG: HAMP domain-containing protein [Anaerolineaceae bacterium]|nr:HAMP domain-containing protein [Anaerolineaceae bacterium]